MNKAAETIGNISDCSEEDIRHCCYLMIRNQSYRKQLSENGRVLINGDGPRLVINAVRKKNITLRNVTRLDRELIFRWANDRLIRKASYSQGAISWEEHIRWFAALEDKENCKFYIAENEKNKPVGQVRFAINKTEAIISLSVALEHRMSGYGHEILIQAAKKVFSETGIEKISAYIRSENKASLETFQKSGFRLEKETVANNIKSKKLILLS